MYGAFNLEAAGDHIVETLTSSVYSPTVPADADAIAVEVEDVAVRYRIDGEDPTSTDGFSLAAGRSDIIPIRKAKGISFLGNGATLQIQFLRIVKAV